MKIKDFSLTRLHDEEHFQFYTSFRDLVLVFGALALKIELLFNLFLAAYANELVALDVVQKSAISDDLKDSDKERDEVFRGMCDAVKSGLNYYDPDVRASAKRLQIVLDTYGNLAVKPYEAETGGLNSLIHDFTTTYAADVAKVTLTGWATELQAKNKAFNDLKNSRYSEEAVKTLLRMKQERLKTDSIYRQITERLNALIIVEGEAAYLPFVNELNKRIEGYDNTVSIRRGKSKKSTDTPDEAK